MSAIEIVEDSENRLLGRRELVLKFNAGNGLLSRQGAVDAISSRFGVGKDNVMVISLYGGSGTRDYYAKTYLFPAGKSGKKQQLPEYISLRHLSKEDRKKAREEKRKGAAAKSAKPSGEKE